MPAAALRARRIRAGAVVAALLMGSASGARASAASCTRADQDAIASALPRLTTWSAIHAYVTIYAPRCDDGWMAEGYSDVVVKTLASQWARVGDLARLAERDPAFRAFVIRHVDATTDRGDLRAVLANADRRCPRELTELCAALRTAAKAALDEAGRP